jgi:ABC-type transporter Mla MlaB component
MLKTGINETDNRRMLTFEGDLTIEHAEEVWRTLRDIPGDGKAVSLRLDKVTSADVSCLQIICAVHRASEAASRVFVFDGNVSEPFAQAARNAGFVRYNCGAAKDTTVCLWRGIENE